MGLTIYGFSIHNCRISPKNLTFFLYVTYFYDNKCGNLTEIYENTTLEQYEYNPCDLMQPNGTTNETGVDVGRKSNIIEVLLQRVEFPDRSRRSQMIHDFLTAYLILDSLWIITAFGLLAGVCLYVSDLLSVIFYFPWVLVAAAVIMLDTITIFVFAIDIVRTDTATYWLRTVGAKNIANLTDLDWKLPQFVTMLPSITMLLGGTRLVFLYVLNVYLFFAILSAAMYAYRYSFYDDEGKIMLYKLVE